MGSPDFSWPLRRGRRIGGGRDVGAWGWGFVELIWMAASSTA